jgi:hypothetical protein
MKISEAMKLRSTATICAMAAIQATACGSSEAAWSTDAHPDAMSGVRCAMETRKDTFAPGMSKTGPSGYAVELMSADPSPPARFSNAWRLRIRDAQAAPCSGTLQVTPWMPDHNHGAPTKPIVTTATAGEYQVDQISLWMPALWQVKIHIDDGVYTDDLAFAFCVEE